MKINKRVSKDELIVIQNYPTDSLIVSIVFMTMPKDNTEKIIIEDIMHVEKNIEYEDENFSDSIKSYYLEIESSNGNSINLFFHVDDNEKIKKIWDDLHDYCLKITSKPITIGENE